jgi:ppGpp synthetase/RelA/SpoT-type nucleotidyltranferase
MDSQSPGAGHRSGQPRAAIEKPGDDRERIRVWLADQVAEYGKEYPRYKRYAEMLEEVLRLAAKELAPLAIIQTREKSIASFAEKAVRKKHKYADPVYQLTDLCGARVITHTRSEVEAFCQYLKDNFDIDWDNSLDTSQRLRPTEFGYRSVHYIIEFKRIPEEEEDERKDKPYGIDIPEELFGLKAEVQVRTLVEHAYADYGHDLTYKGAFELPTTWQRELASVAAALEEVDQTFSRIEERLRDYTTSYGRYSTDEERQREIDMLEIILEHVPDNVGLSMRLGQLARAQEDWHRAIRVLSHHVKRENLKAAPQPVLRDLGVALCMTHDPDCPFFQDGRVFLECACAAEPADVDALCSMAGTWKNIDEERVHHYYRRAFEADPHDAYALGNYLECELRRGTAVLDTARPLIERAAERCDAHIAAGINLPWAFYNLGKFHFLLGEPYQSLEAYAKAVQLSTAAWMIKTSLNSVERLGSLAPELEGYEWNRRLLLLGLAARFGSAEAKEELAKLATPDCAKVAPPVRIVAGGTDPRVQEQIEGYSELLMGALAGFQGTIIASAFTRSATSREHSHTPLTTLATTPLTRLPPMPPSTGTPTAIVKFARPTPRISHRSSCCRTGSTCWPRKSPPARSMWSGSAVGRSPPPSTESPWHSALRWASSPRVAGRPEGF